MNNSTKGNFALEFGSITFKKASPKNLEALDAKSRMTINQSLASNYTNRKSSSLSPTKSIHKRMSTIQPFSMYTSNESV